MKILDRGSTHTLENQLLKKWAFEYHSNDFVAHPNAFIDRELEEYEACDRILVPSRFVADTFLKHQTEHSKLLRIPYGASISPFADAETAELKRDANAVLFVGQVSERKGIGVLVDAMREVRKERPDTVLWIADFVHSSCRRFIREHWIKYLGVLSASELAVKYREAGVFCLPSFEEGLALVLTEAAQFGCRIVATTNTGAEDLGLPAGMLYSCSPGAQQELAISILRALSNQGNQNSGNVSKPPTSEAFVDKLLDCIDSSWRGRKT